MRADAPLRHCYQRDEVESNLDNCINSCFDWVQCLQIAEKSLDVNSGFRGDLLARNMILGSAHVVDPFCQLYG